MNTAIENRGVQTHSPAIQQATVKYVTPARDASIKATNKRLAAGRDNVFRKAAENTRRLTGQERF